MSQQPPAVVVRRNAALFGIVGAASVGLAIAFLARSEGVLDTVLGAVFALVGVVHVFAMVGVRHPLLQADGTGVVVRVGNGWQQLPWTELRQVVVEQPDSVLRDGRVVVQPRDTAQLADLGVLGRIHTVWSRRWYGASLSVPLAMTTTASSDDVAGDLGALADGRTDVVALRGKQLATLAEVPARLGALVSRAGHGRSRDVDADVPETAGIDEPLQLGHVELPGIPAPQDLVEREPVAEPVEAEQVEVETAAPAPVAPVAPLRDPVAPRRAEVTRAVPAAPAQQDEEPRLRTFVFDATQDAPDPAGTDEAAGAATEDHREPVIGPVIRAARERVRLSIDELSERTRIRPHVLAAIEIDDFGPCGGDFYARGHLATLARSLGLDLDALMREYDARYAHGPINARRVFEAELATGLHGGMRATVGGPKWSLLVAAVLCLLMVWGVARMVSDPPEPVAIPGEESSAGLAANREPIVSPKMKLSTMTVTAAHGDTKVVVKDRTGRVLWSGDLTQGDKRKVAGRAPFEVEADNAAAVEVQLMGKPQGPVGPDGTPATRSFG